MLVAVDDVTAAHAWVLRAGATHGLHAIRLGDRCVFCCVRDPHGNWIELVQYASDNGALPNAPFADTMWPEITDWREDGTPS